MPGYAAPPQNFRPWRKEEKTPTANDNARRIPVLGMWKGAEFKFNSPEAEAEWVRKAYRSGIHETNWHLGKVVDDKSRDVILAGIGGPQPGIYQAPDGTYRTINPKTIEAKAARDHRAQHVRGKTIDQIAGMAKMPGEDEWVEDWAARHLPLSARKAAPPASPAANDNTGQAAAGTAPTTPPAAAAIVAGRGPLPPQQRKARQERNERAGARTATAQEARATAEPLNMATAPSGGRFGSMPQALAETSSQDAEDIARLGTNSLLGDYGDEARAALDALGDWWEGKSFADSYGQHFEAEKQETEAARGRQGWKGTAAEMVTGAIPVVGDVSGAIADFKDWKESGDNWGWEDYGLVALGLVPGLANRKSVKGAVKIADDLISEGKKLGGKIADLAKRDARLGKAEASSYDHRAGLDRARAKVYTEREARHLGGENRGLIYVQEKMRGTERSMKHQSGGHGAFSDIESRKFASPALRFDNPNTRGVNYIRFDNAYPAADNSHTVMVDSKTKLPVWSKAAQSTTIETLERVKHAVMQNPGYKIQYEFDTDKAAEQAKNFLRDNNYSQYVAVGVRKP